MRPGRRVPAAALLAFATLLAAPGSLLADGVTAYLMAYGAYGDRPLKTSANDLRAIEAALKNIGVRTRSILDKDIAKSDEFIQESIAELSKTIDIVIFYIKGHGWSNGSQNYVAAVDVDIDGDIDQQKLKSVNLNNVITKLSYSGAKGVVFILDSCRSDVSRSQPANEASQSRPAGPALPLEDGVKDSANFVFIYSAAPGVSSYEGELPLSSFGRALSHELENSSGLSAVQLLMRVASVSNRISIRKGELKPSNPYVVNMSAADIYIDAQNLPVSALHVRFDDDLLRDHPITPVDWSSHDLKIPVGDEIDPASSQPLIGFDEAGEFYAADVLDGVKKFFADNFARLTIEAGVDFEYAKYGQTNQQILGSFLHLRRLKNLPNGDLAFIAKLNWLPLCGAAGNCPIYFIRGKRGEPIEWSFELEDDEKTLVDGGNHIFVVDGKDGDHQIFIAGHSGAAIDGLSKYTWGYSLSAEDTIFRDVTEIAPLPEEFDTQLEAQQ